MLTNLRVLPLAVLLTSTAHGFQFEFEPGSKWSSSLDSTITYGATYRLQSQSRELLQDINLDDSNRSHNKGLVQNNLRILSDFELRYDADNGNRYGLFSRATAYYDHQLHGRDSDHEGTFGPGLTTLNSSSFWGGSIQDTSDFHKDTIDRAGRGKELLDLFVFADINPQGNHPISLRLGRQVINWGESAFIQNGISAFMNPADVSKAQLPGTEVKEILRPQGAAYGSIALTENITLQAYVQYEWERNVLPPTGTYLSAVPDVLPEDGGEILLTPPTSPFGTTVEKTDADANDNGQWGVALNWYVPELNDTEFGFYVLNYHNKTPSAAAINPTGNPADITVESRVIEDIKLYGFSWNTVIPATETAVSGEIAYHEGAQVQIMPLAGSPGVGLLGSSAAAGPNSDTFAAARRDLVILQTTFNQDMNFITFADDASAIVELGWVHTAGLEDGESWLFNGQRDRDSWGYKARFRFTWYDGLGRLLPSFSGTDILADINWSHDVEGSAPIAGTGFSDNAKAFGLGLEAIWQNTWSVRINYTNYFGSGQLTTPVNPTAGYDDFNAIKVDDHVLGDRDFVSLAVKYRF
jgi:hypothetical protein